MFGFSEHVIHTVCLFLLKHNYPVFFAKGKHIELMKLRVQVILYIYIACMKTNLKDGK